MASVKLESNIDMEKLLASFEIYEKFNNKNIIIK